MRSVVFVDGCRLPFQRSGTGYRDLNSYDLARLNLKALLRRSQLSPEEVGYVILGTVISNVSTSNVARDAALAAGIPSRVPAHTVTQACISSNQAFTSAVDLIRTGQVDVAIAGGTESMTDIPIRLRRRLRLRLVEAQRYRGWKDWLGFVRGLRPSDFLPEIPAIAEFSTGRTMGADCDMMAARLGVNRQEQDEYAVRSHHLAAQATARGLLAPEVEAVRLPPDFQVIDRDNGIREDTSLEKAARLQPAFIRPYGTITAANSSFFTDGAAALLLMAEEVARARGLKPRVRVRDFVYTGQDPEEELLLGPAYATPRLLQRNGLSLGDISVFEFHEAFAAQILANLKCLASDQFAREKLGLPRKVGEIPMERFNCWGGSLSLGHPFGATGARLVTTAANRLMKEDGQFALVASCAAGALGSAILLERIE